MHYVIGDIHGCYQDLMRLLETIEKRDPRARFLFVGDFIDRGPEVWTVLEWAKSHITKSGKYRSVRGNHEEMAIEWYMDYCVWYESRPRITPPPLPMFDFLERVTEQGMEDPELLEQYIRFFAGLPYKLQVKVSGRGIRPVIYDIVHAWMPPKGTPVQYREGYYLWDRDNAFAGNDENDHIIIHGHTPTTYEGRFIPEAVPGMILYRRNAVNIDGGCVFGPRHEKYPCMLAAICLETLEEIYPYTMEERMAMQMPGAAEKTRKAVAEAHGKRHAAYLKNEFRKEMLERLRQEESGQPGRPVGGSV